MPATRSSNKDKDFFPFFHLRPHSQKVEKPTTARRKPTTSRPRSDSLPRVITPEPGPDYESSQALSAGPEEMEAATILLQMRYGSWPMVLSTPLDASASSSVPVLFSTASSPLSTLGSPSPTSPPAPAVASTTSRLSSPSPPTSPPFSNPIIDLTSTTSFTPINAPLSSHSLLASSFSAPTTDDAPTVIFGRMIAPRAFSSSTTWFTPISNASPPPPSIPAPSSPSLEASAPRLFAYLRNRNPSRALRRAEAILHQPTRTMHLPTSTAACVRCQERGVECVTALERKHCVYCASQGGRGRYTCSKRDERLSSLQQWRAAQREAGTVGKGREGDEMEVDEEGE